MNHAGPMNHDKHMKNEEHIKGKILYAHDEPRQTLYEHLQGTMEWAGYFRQLAAGPVLQELPDRLFKEFILLHDLGKATGYFQRYLLDQTEEGEMKNHAEFSALFFLAYECRKGIRENEAHFIMAMFYCILRHHGDLVSIKDAYNYYINEERKSIFIKQWESIDQVALKELLNRLGLTGGENFLTADAEGIFDSEGVFDAEGRFDWTVGFDWAEMFDHVQEFIKKQRRKYNKTVPDYRQYYLTQMLFSLLTDADKSQAGLRKMDYIIRPQYQADVPAYIGRNNQGESALNSLRNQALNEAAQNVIHSGPLMTLTLPTGMGKTFTSFHAAITLKNHLKQETGKDYRIIYVIPFMSIIDQNAMVFEQLLAEQNGSIGQNLILKHHHLAELVWANQAGGNENQIINSPNAKLLIEGWNSEVIVTTFHQFFLTLIGYRNAMQRKFSKLANAIVIIDEIQAVPVKYYKLIGQMLEWYTEIMGSKVIAMTATQPYIFNNRSIELCEADQYFQNLSRTKIITDFQRRQTVDEFTAALDCSGERTCLFIINTIACGRQMYENLCQKYPDENILFLSTLMTPHSRRTAIAKIKKGRYRLVVSSQLVEAGVDIDFDIVYRDFAPLPSLFQSAGRSNREGDPSKVGQVCIITLVDGTSGRRYCDLVYRQSAVDLAVTEKALVQKEYNEAEFIDIIRNYFRLISDEETKSQAESDNLLLGIKEQFYEGEFTDKRVVKAAPISQFVLIDDNNMKFPVFIEENQEAAALWSEYQKLSILKNESWEQKIQLRGVAKKMADYIINVSDSTFLKYNRPPLDINGLYYYVAQDELSRYYQHGQGYGILSNTYFYD